MMSSSHPARRPETRRRTLLGLTALLPLALATLAPPVAAQPPRQNLWVELRWVEQEMSGAAAAGARDGSVVVSTGGSVSPRGGVTYSTRDIDSSRSRERLLPRVMVLNGQQASVTLNEATPMQWVDITLDHEKEQPGQSGQSGQSGQTAQSSQATSSSQSASGPRPDRYFVTPRQGMVERTRGLTVKPVWPGGRQPVTVEVRTQDHTTRPAMPTDGSTPQDSPDDPSVLSTVQIPLGRWVTIARSGNAYGGSPRGVYSTRDAEVQKQKELQVRVDLAP